MGQPGPLLGRKSRAPLLRRGALFLLGCRVAANSPNKVSGFRLRRNYSMIPERVVVTIGLVVYSSTVGV